MDSTTRNDTRLGSPNRGRPDDPLAGLGERDLLATKALTRRPIDAIKELPRRRDELPTATLSERRELSHITASNDERQDHGRRDITDESNEHGNEGNGDDVHLGAVSAAGPSDSDEDRYRLLVPVLDAIETEDVERLVETAVILAREREGTLLVLYLATLVRSTPLDAVSANDPVAVEAHEELKALLDVATETGVRAEGLVYWTHDEAELIHNAVENQDCDGVILATQAEHTQRRCLLSGDSVEKVLARA